MKFFTKKKANGDISHLPISEKIQRELSDDDNPITFAHGLDEDLDEFASDVKNDFEISMGDNEEDFRERENKRDESSEKADFELAREIMNEADDIGESELPEEEKIIELYNLFQTHEHLLSEAQKGIILGKITGIQKQMNVKGKNMKIANDIQNSLLSKLYGSKKQEKQDEKKPVAESRENKSPRDDSRSSTEKKSKESSKPSRWNDDDDWEERSAKLIAMAER